MSLLKYIDRLKRMDDLINRKATGNVEAFAEKLGISRSQLLQDLKELRESGAPIEFNTKRQCYMYTRQYSIIVNISEVKGGKNALENLNESSITGLAFCSLLAQGKKNSVADTEKRTSR